MVIGIKRFAFAGLVSVFGLLAARAEDSYLYWLVDAHADQYDYTAVKVRASDGSGSELLNLYPDMRDVKCYDTAGPAGEIKEIAQYGGILGFWAALTTSQHTYADGASYVIELYHDDTLLAQSEELFYSEAVANHFVNANASQGQTNIWMPTAFAAPEPNSALLMLVGCAVLALRRRPQGKV